MVERATYMRDDADHKQVLDQRIKSTLCLN